MKMEMPDAKRQPLSKKSVARMIHDFSNVNTLLWVGVAVVIHAVVISALSINNFRDWADPEGAKVRAAAEAKKGEPPAPAKAPAAAPGTTPAAETTSADKTKPAAKEPTDDEKMMEKRKDSPVMKAITDKAKPTEIPKEPHSEGISLDETLNNK